MLSSSPHYCGFHRSPLFFKGRRPSKSIRRGGPPKRKGYLSRERQKENTVITRRDKAPLKAVSESALKTAREASRLTPGAGHREPGVDESQHLVEIVQASLEDDKPFDAANLLPGVTL